MPWSPPESSLILPQVFGIRREDLSGQIILTNQPGPPKGSFLERKLDPIFQGNLGW